MCKPEGQDLRVGPVLQPDRYKIGRPDRSKGFSWAVSVNLNAKIKLINK
jgi:hypothetical protein